MSRAQLTSTVEQNTGGAVSPYVAGKNVVINGAFDIWQRGTSIAYTGSGSTTFTADRCAVYANGNGSFTFSRQTFTPGAAPVAGYEGQYFYRTTTNTLGTSNAIYYLQNAIENVQTFAGQTVTLSFWARSDAARTLNLALTQIFGTGGSSAVAVTSSVSVTTSWARYSYTVALASISGKTIGAGSYLQVRLDGVPTASQTMDFWGLQLEAGSVATPFTTATGTLSGELTACQRYYYQVANGTIGPVGGGFNNGTTTMETVIQFPVTMRTTPTISQAIGTDYYVFNRAGANDGFNSLTVDRASQSLVICYNSTEISGTSGNAGWVYTNNASAFLSFQAEL